MKKKIFWETLKSLFITGLIAILPLGLTYAVIAFVWHFVYMLLSPLRYIEPLIFRKIPYSEVVFALLGIVLIGAVIHLFDFKRIIEMIEQKIENLPLFGQVYSGARKLVHALGGHDAKGKESMQKIVFVEFPKAGQYALGLVMNTFAQQYAPDKAKEYYNVFVPMPNSVHGFFLIVATDACIETAMTRQEAMTLIFSGGIISPDGRKKE
ncbi:MAG: hypothetical protein UU47_C0005G0022 [candidate division TM6 bacterium GW2011_GWE2_41_16]|nr:MAG: hypothetical protein UU47_C0005G0022 [candidate division TM6 bacterium GW2011_GWE2_41_16]